eukprot:scaffold7291_cov100-Skeletonema_marinoi.AAC.1
MDGMGLRGGTKLLKSVALNTNSYVIRTLLRWVVEDGLRHILIHVTSQLTSGTFFGAKSSEKLKSITQIKWAFIRSSLRRQLLTLVLLYSLVLYNTYLYQHWCDKSEKSRLISCRG